MAAKKQLSSKTWVDNLAKLLQGVPKDSSALSDMIDLTEQHRLINTETSAMLKGALQIADMDVRDIMIPRIRMTWVPHDADLHQALRAASQSGHARLPVFNEEKDAVVGMLMAKDMLAEIEKKPDMDFSITDILRAPMFVPESKPLHILLQEFRSKRVHMAIVVNEYGGTAGLVTIEDIIEEIIGDIQDEHDINDDNNASIQLLDNGKYVIDALLPIDEFNNYFTTSFDDSEYETIGGLVLDAFGRLPHDNDTTELDNLQFRVLAADKKRILRLELHALRNTQDK